MKQRYFINFADAPAGLFSVKNFRLREALGEPYVLEVMATCTVADWPLLESLGQPATFAIKSLLPSPVDRTWHGVLRGFEQDYTSADETVYRLTLAPRLDLLRDSFHSRLFQNKTVPEIIEDMLRHHGLAGDDFRMNLSRDYAIREYTTQYNETDYDFVRRLMEDEGLWFRFEQNEKDVIVFGDDLSHYQRGRMPDYFRPDSGLEPGLEAVRKFVVNCRNVPSKVLRHDYNYRTADVDLLVEAVAGEAPATHGRDYRWGQHHKDPAYGQVLSQIRQEAWLTEQVTARGESNVSALAPGLVLTTDQPWPEAPKGWLVLEIIHQGARDQSYENSFKAMPADRPFRLRRVTPWPKIQGTLPARVVSPGDYQYAYLDEMGRYRVRLPFDLDTWSPAGDSRPIRLMRPYSGPVYGQHFPLHEGTEVMLGFVGGDPDRPFIYNAMHDSDNPDHVPDTWNTRNVIRTWANNKLRLEDKVGEEHVKLATEYEKTQLNLGHLVDGGREERGQGLELRTDGWGAVRAAKGIYLSADLRPEALGKQLDMREAAMALQNVVSQAKGLEAAAKYAKTTETPADDLEQLAEDLNELKKPGLVLDAPEGLALTAEAELVLSATRSLTVSAAKEVDLSTEADLTMTAAEGLTMFAKDSGGMAAAASQDMIIQAQTDKLAVAADQDLYLRTASGEIINAAEKEVVFTCGEAYIKIKDGNIEFGCPGQITAKSSTWNLQGPASMNVSKALPQPEPLNWGLYEEFFTIIDENDYPIKGLYYQITGSDGSIEGRTDNQGRTKKIRTKEPQSVQLVTGRIYDELIDAYESAESLPMGTLYAQNNFTGTATDAYFVNGDSADPSSDKLDIHSLGSVDWGEYGDIVSQPSTPNNIPVPSQTPEPSPAPVSSQTPTPSQNKEPGNVSAVSPEKTEDSRSESTTKPIGESEGKTVRAEGRLITEEEGRLIVAEAATWEGSPYSYGGKTKSGADCSGSTFAIYRDAGFPYAHNGTSTFVGYATGTTDKQPYPRFKEVDIPQEGDIAWWNGHVAIYHNFPEDSVEIEKGVAIKHCIWTTRTNGNGGKYSPGILEWWKGKGKPRWFRYYIWPTEQAQE